MHKHQCETDGVVILINKHARPSETRAVDVQVDLFSERVFFKVEDFNANIKLLPNSNEVILVENSSAKSSTALW